MQLCGNATGYSLWSDIFITSILELTNSYGVHIYREFNLSRSQFLLSLPFSSSANKPKTRPANFMINLCLTIDGDMPREHAADRCAKPDSIALSAKKHEGMAITICSNY